VLLTICLEKKQGDKCRRIHVLPSNEKVLGTIKLVDPFIKEYNTVASGIDGWLLQVRSKSINSIVTIQAIIHREDEIKMNTTRK